MTSITAQTHATLDGVIDAPPADALLPYMSDAGRQGALDLALAADALLLGRETWQGLAGAWRGPSGFSASAADALLGICWPTGSSTCSCYRSRPSWPAPAGDCSTTPATSCGF